MTAVNAPNERRGQHSVRAGATDVSPAVWSASAAARPPVVSVVIPAYNCARTLGDCLASLFAQTYPPDRFEIIVVNDGSIDETAAIATVAATTGGWKGHFALLSQPNGGPASARNTGIHAATGQIVAFTDADCVAAPDWLASLVHVFEGHPDVAGVGGPLQNAAQANTVVARYLLAAEFYRHRTRGGTVDYLVTANAAFRRAVLLSAGGFIERERAWAEDADLSFRLVQSGYTLLLSPQGTVTHLGVLKSVRDFASELYRYGFGNAVLARGWPGWRHPSVQLVRHLGAIVLAPWLALRLRRRVGWREVVAFWPLVVVEHAAFSAGLVSGWLAETWRGRNTSDERAVRERRPRRA